MTVHAPSQFSPFQVLDAGQRAEAEGRYDFAVQFYRHLANHYPQTREAAVANEALVRIALLRDEAEPRAAGAPALNGRAGREHHREPYPVPDQARSAIDGGRRGMSLAPAGADRQPAAFVAPRQHAEYRTGRVLARLITWLGGIGVVSSLALTPVMLVNPRLFAGIPLVELAAVWDVSVGASVVGGGMLMVVLGQLMRAVFDAANASRDLADITRARAEHESTELKARKTAPRH